MEHNFNMLDVRVWGQSDDEWPEKRVSLSNAWNGHAIAINPRYGTIEDGKIQFNYIAKATNLYPELVEQLEEARDLIAEVAKRSGLSYSEAEGVLIGIENVLQKVYKEDDK